MADSHHGEVPVVTNWIPSRGDLRRFPPRLAHWSPVGRSECAEIVLVGHGGQPGEHVAKVNKGIFAVTQTGDDDRVEDRGALAGVGMTNEEPVFLPDDGWPDGVLHYIGVQPGLAVTQMRGARFPVCQQIIAGLPPRAT